MEYGKNEFTTNAALKARRDEALPAGLPSKSGVYVARAEGAELWDVEGKRYIDFIGGIGVLNVGHRHPKVVAAIKKQVDGFLHTSFGIAQYEVYVDLAEKLNKLAPGPTKKKTALFNSGAEAVENAVKFARRITGRPGVIAFEGAFHGRTLLSTTLTGKSKPYKVGFGPLVPAVYHAPYPDAFHGVTLETAKAGLNHIFKSMIPAEEVAAMIVEPVQGEGGFNPAPKEFPAAPSSRLRRERHSSDRG
ncbi:MAG: aminotransferase class III-fold pyridoxal phosphate-dependent enzyme [Parvularculaceae bacterium]